VIPADAALLVVDDNEDNRYTLAQRLKRQGYGNLSMAANGREALEAMHERRFDLVLLDVMMPELNGYEVLEQMRADPVLRDIPVIMISAVDQLESVVRCIELGAEDYLAKPFNPTLLRARVGASLEKKRLRDQVDASLARLEHELDAARTLQMSMLPRVFPDWSEARPVQLHAYMEPAREVGGDLYDFFFAPPNVLCFVVADVSGKGAHAAIHMARTRSLVRMAVELHRRLGVERAEAHSIVEAVNQELCQDNSECMFATVVAGFLDVSSGVLECVNAGHPAPWLLRADREPERMSAAPQLPLGVKAGTRYSAHTFRLEPGDSLFVCTDGVAEAMNEANEFYSEHRLESALNSLRGAAPADMLRLVREDVARFTGDAPVADDLTMLAVLWQPRNKKP